MIKIKKLYFVSCLLLLAGCRSTEDNYTKADEAILDLFPKTVVQMPEGKQGKTILSDKYTVSGSKWGKGLDEKIVFRQEIKHEQGEKNSYQLRIGKGGQLYSLRGAFGESVPPSSKASPWNDEVWQAVVVGSFHMPSNLPKAIQEKVNKSPYSVNYCVHNSGVYITSPLNSGQVTISYAVMLDKDDPAASMLILRDFRDGIPISPCAVTISPGGAVAGSKRIADIKPGVWYNVEISLDFEKLDKKESRKTKIRIYSQAEKLDKTIEVPFADKSFSMLNWLGLSASSTKGIFYLDNWKITQTDEGETFTVDEDDFEDYKPGAVWPGVRLTEKDTKAKVIVSNKAAFESKNSLAFHDAKLKADWQPMQVIYPSGGKLRNLYCPHFASAIAEGGTAFRTLNWGLVPHVQTVHRSPILYYIQTRDVGDGVIEITYTMHNFSLRDNVSFNWFNAPWGGTRLTSLPYHYLSMPDGSLIGRDEIEKRKIWNGINVRSTGGWNLSSAGETDDSPSLALVFGRDKHLEAEYAKKAAKKPYLQYGESLYRGTVAGGLFDGWDKIPENIWRNYEVAVVIPKFHMYPGTTLWYRSYLVVNSRKHTIELAKSLVDKVEYGVLTFDPETTEMLPVSIKNNKVVPKGKVTFKLFSKPVPGSKPLFLIENATTGQEVITTDLYNFVKKEARNFGFPKEHPQAEYFNNATAYFMAKNNSKWKRMLGYAYQEKPKTGNYKRLSEVIPKEMLGEAGKYNLDLWVRE